MIAELLREQGDEPIIFPIILDAKDALADALKEACEVADLVLINGGSSKGSEDFNSKLLEEDASYYRHGANIVPGRVLATSVIDGKPVVNLPGPTIGAFAATDWCVRYLIPHLQGIPMKPRAKVEARVVEAPSRCLAAWGPTASPVALAR